MSDLGPKQAAPTGKLSSKKKAENNPYSISAIIHGLLYQLRNRTSPSQGCFGVQFFSLLGMKAWSQWWVHPNMSLLTSLCGQNWPLGFLHISTNASILISKIKDSAGTVIYWTRIQHSHILWHKFYRMGIYSSLTLIPPTSPLCSLHGSKS